MRIAMLLSAEDLEHEAAVLRRQIGVMHEEGAGVALILPEDWPAERIAAMGLDEPSLAWPGRAGGAGLNELADALGRIGIDLLHAASGASWETGIELARRLELPLVLGATAGTDVAGAGMLLTEKPAAEVGESVKRRPVLSTAIAVAAATEPIRAAVSESLGPEVRVELLRPGVADSAAESHATGAAPCGVILCEGGLEPASLALLDAVRSVAAARPEVQFFLDCGGGESHAIWQAVRRMDLLSHISLVPRTAGHYELLLNAAAVIRPEASGIVRSIVPAAMARRCVILAVADPWVDYLIDNQTAWLASPEAADRAQTWADLLRRWLDQPDHAQRLGRSAREYALSHFNLHNQTAAFANLYRKLAGEPIRFPGRT